MQVGLPCTHTNPSCLPHNPTRGLKWQGLCMVSLYPGELHSNWINQVQVFKTSLLITLLHFYIFIVKTNSNHLTLNRLAYMLFSVHRCNTTEVNEDFTWSTIWSNALQNWLWGGTLWEKKLIMIKYIARYRIFEISEVELKGLTNATSISSTALSH